MHYPDFTYLSNLSRYVDRIHSTRELKQLRSQKFSMEGVRVEAP